MAKVIIHKYDMSFSGIPGDPLQLAIWYSAVPDYYETFIINPGSVELANPPLQDGAVAVNRAILDKIKTSVGAITGSVIKDSDILFQPFITP